MAQVKIPDEYGEHIRYRSQIGALKDDLLGENISLATGGLEIIQTDVDLPGNNALPVRVGRRFIAGNRYGSFGYFGAWELDIPYLHGVFSNSSAVGGPAKSGWTVWAQMLGGTSADLQKRCSFFTVPPPVSVKTTVFDPTEYWIGNFFYLPGSGDLEMLERNVSSQIPNDGHAYPVATKGGGVMRCLGSLDSVVTPGEGFEAIMPDGTIYTFNHMVAKSVVGLYKAPPLVGMSAAQSLTGSLPQDANQFQGEVSPLAQPPNTGSTLPRNEVRIYPTQIKDRFGNSVTYVWNAAHPGQLDQIIASDGRQVTFNYAVENNQSVIRFSIGAHTWTYMKPIAPVGTAVTDTMQLPDGSVWSYDLDNILSASAFAHSGLCGSYPIDRGSWTGSITAPSGVRVEYKVTSRSFGRSWVIENCLMTAGGAEYLTDPNVFSAISIDSKKVTGPGLPAAGHTWTYSYSPLTYCWYPGGASPPGYPNTCTASSPTTRWVSVTDPAGVVTRYTFGNRHMVNEGLLLKEEAGWNGVSALNTVEYDYASPDAAPYAAVSGFPLRSGGDEEMTSRHHPLRKRATTQQGRIFTWEVASDCSGAPYCFDSRARPTKVINSSAPAP